MALIKCPECKADVSSTAASCPQCGSPVSAAGGNAAGVAVTTLQETSKKLKLQMLMFLAAFVGGLIWAIASEGESVVGIVILVVGLIGLFVTKFRVWWHHK